MRYASEAVCGALYPKLLGTYESELLPVIKLILEGNFRTIIDIGAAEGYYACGLARAIPKAKVVAFEADLKGRYLLAQNISLNGLENRITVEGLCDVESLQQQLKVSETPVLIVCDAEGYEYDLLSPSEVKHLRECWILVELHEFMLEGITELIKERFVKTHDIVQMSARDRVRQDFPLFNGDFYVEHVPLKYIHEYLTEKRPAGMSWFWMTPRQDPAPT
jgi:tRNA G37 N-methylase Trm5